MEALFIFIAKSSGLIILFYCAYYFLLRKETFFNNNRWFLLAGLFSSVLLPFIVYTKTVWVDPTPLANLNFSQVLVTQPIAEQTFKIDWYYCILAIYGIGLLFFVLKFVMDFYSLHSVLKKQKIQKKVDFKFIDTIENIAPFSYFDYIVYNSSLYTDAELENIIEHEKVHSEQNHTIDVLIARIFCIVFWFNPIIWFYKKAITQNLEFIADQGAIQKIADKRAYQYTLLRITTHENCVSITNHFYQSLIKKRIIMLNQTQSKKRNSWKFYIIVPAIVAFVLLFQVKVIAREKQLIEVANKNSNPIDVFKITKTTTDEELSQKTLTLKENYGLDATFYDLERNSKKEIVSIKVALKKGDEIIQEMGLKGTQAIKDFGIIISKLDNGKLNIDFKTDEKVVKEENLQTLAKGKDVFINNEKVAPEELENLDPNEIESVEVSKNADRSTIRIITKNLVKPIKISDKQIYIDRSKSTAEERSQLDKNSIDKVGVTTNVKTVTVTTKTDNDPKPIIVINGNFASPELSMNDIDPKKISSMSVLKGKSAEDKYGIEGKNGVIEIITKVVIGKNETEALQGKIVQGFPLDPTKTNDKISSVTIKNQTDLQSVVSTSKTRIKMTGNGTGNQLVVVDGEIISDKNFNLDSLDIERMDVLKGYKAIEKYGIRGKDGVIVITTRK